MSGILNTLPPELAVLIQNLTEYLKRESSMVGRSVSTNYTLVDIDFALEVNTVTAGAGVTITLPAASRARVGKLYLIKDTGGLANTYNIIISGTQEGGSSSVIDISYGYKLLRNTGAMWVEIANKEDIAALEAAIASLESRVTSLESRVTALESLKILIYKDA